MNIRRAGNNDRSKDRNLMALQFRISLPPGPLTILQSAEQLSKLLLSIAEADTRMSDPIFFREGYPSLRVKTGLGLQKTTEQIAQRMLTESASDSEYIVGSELHATSIIGFLVGWTFRGGGLETSFTAKIGAPSHNGLNVLADNGSVRLDYGSMRNLFECAVANKDVVFTQIQPRDIKLLRLIKQHKYVLGIDNFFSRGLLAHVPHSLHGFTIRHTERGVHLQSNYRPDKKDASIPDEVRSTLAQATGVLSPYI